MSDLTTSPLPTDGAAPAEPCPTPLEWRQVLAGFRDARQVVTLQDHVGLPNAFIFGSGSPLFFLNPAAGSHEQFALLAWLLREEFQCVFMDYRDDGPFSRPVTSLGRMADDLAAVADQLQHDTFAVCAAGFGSLPALQLMIDSPGRVEGTALVCGFAGRRFTWFEHSLIFWGRMAPGRLASLPGWRGLQEQNHRPCFPPFDATRWDFLVDDLGATSTRQLAIRLQIADSVNFRPRLANVATPTLLVRTEGEGPALTRCQDELEAGLPHVRSEWMHTSGQYPHLTHPHRLAKLLKTFIAEIRNPAGVAGAPAD